MVTGTTKPDSTLVRVANGTAVMLKNYRRKYQTDTGYQSIDLVIRGLVRDLTIARARVRELELKTPLPVEAQHDSVQQ